jgi:hypothetical protein
MTRPRFMGYGKPVVTARDGALSVENVPPPWPSEQDASGTLLQKMAKRMNIVRLVDVKLKAIRQKHEEHWMRNAEETALLIFSDVFAMHERAGRTGILVYLPIKDDYTGKDSDAWRAWLEGHARKNGWLFMDLVSEMRKLPKEDIRGLFIRDDSPYAGARGHYTESGNAWVAATVHRLLLANTELAGRLANPAPL